MAYNTAIYAFMEKIFNPNNNHCEIRSRKEANRNMGDPNKIIINRSNTHAHRHTHKAIKLLSLPILMLCVGLDSPLDLFRCAQQISMEIQWNLVFFFCSIAYALFNSFSHFGVFCSQFTVGAPTNIIRAHIVHILAI